jgi:Flp pilus assembly protein TadD
LFGPPIHVEDGASAYRVYRKAPTGPLERGRYLNDLAGFSLRAREFELALERIEQAIALDPGVDAYEARRALIVESQAQR